MLSLLLIFQKCEVIPVKARDHIRSGTGCANVNSFPPVVPNPHPAAQVSAQ